MHERLLLIAHGTASPDGAATLHTIAEAVAAARPGHTVDLCFLDVLDPRLPDALDPRPTVAVPLLLSTGYHVRTDIPAAVAHHATTRVTRHLGPHRLLTDALVDRLTASTGDGTVVLAASGSNRPEAVDEVATAAALLGVQLGRSVPTVTVGGDVDAQLAAIDGPLRVATYLLAEGSFLYGLRAAVDRHRRGGGTVADPLGAHPAVVELVWRRYDSLARTR